VCEETIWNRKQVSSLWDEDNKGYDIEPNKSRFIMNYRNDK